VFKHTEERLFWFPGIVVCNLAPGIFVSRIKRRRRMSVSAVVYLVVGFVAVLFALISIIGLQKRKE